MSHPEKKLLCAAVLALLALPLLAEEADDTPGSETIRPVRPGVYVGVARCANGACHGSAEARDTTAVLQNEYATWMLGPHRAAYRVLENELSQEIAAALDPGGKPAGEREDCLACHAFQPPPAKSENVYFEDGISCEACHGPAGGWRDQHFEEDWTYRQSLAAGMKDLRDVRRRGELCISCHQGNTERRVDHRLIAAGHPRLYFELDNYTGRMPRHWNVGRRHSVMGVRAWARGQVTSFRASLEQLAGYAADEDGAWPEFSELHCESCHHSLADSVSPPGSPRGDRAWRRQPGYRYQGGQPPYMKRYAIPRLLVAELAGGELERFDAAVDELARRVSSFRSRQDVIEQAEQVAAILDDVEDEIRGVRWKAGQVRGMMRRVAADRDRFVADLSAAEQAAFALQSLMSRWVELDRKKANSGLARLIDDVFAALDDPNAYDRGRFAEILEKIEAELR